MHAPDPREREREKSLKAMKRQAKETNENTRNIIAANVGELKIATSASMPTMKAMSRMIGRVRTTNSIPKNPNSVEEIILSTEFMKTKKGENFLLYDKGPCADRLIILGTTDNLDFLSTCDAIFMDGTFSVAPPLFYQMYTIHGKIVNVHSLPKVRIH